MIEELLEYYRRRAAEYEKVYAKPERQADLSALREIVPAYFAQRRVLEVACGTGYWTRPVSACATSIVAIDLAAETLAVARTKTTADVSIEYRLGDAFDLAAVPGVFDAGLVAFWWSHVPLADLFRFLTGLHRRLGTGACVLVVDNRYVDGSNHPISRTDAARNTYQRRFLESGEAHEVLKNFPSPAEVVNAIVSAGGSMPLVRVLHHFWYATYVVAGASER